MVANPADVVSFPALTVKAVSSCVRFHRRRFVACTSCVLEVPRMRDLHTPSAFRAGPLCCPGPLRWELVRRFAPADSSIAKAIEERVIDAGGGRSHPGQTARRLGSAAEL